MNNIEVQIKENVMRRVRFIYYVRLIARPVYLEVLVFAAAATTIVFCVSVFDVANNVYHLNHFTHCFNYIVTSFMNTQFLVQAMIVVSVASGVLLARDSVRNFRLWKGRELKTA